MMLKFFNMEKIEIKHLLIFNGIILIVILLSIVFGNRNNKIEDYDVMMAESVSVEYGKSIGRNALLKYLNDTHQLKDSITIDIYELMDIEDSIDSTLNKKK